MQSGRRGQIKRVDVRRATDVDGRRRAWCEWALRPVPTCAIGVNDIDDFIEFVEHNRAAL